MTTRSSAGAALRALRQFVLGPWPFHFGTLWTWMSITVIFVSSRLIGPNPIVPVSAPLSHRVATILLLGLLAPGAALVPLIVYRRLRHRFTRRPVSWPEYMLSQVGASVVCAAIVNAALPIEPMLVEVLNHPGLLNTAARLFVPLWLMNAVLGTVFARIQKESVTAQAALQTVVAQRRLLLESEERVRGQVATYLHDRVQTDLVSIGLRIRAAVASGSQEMVEDVDDALADLERVRADEIRGASRQLSPNLEHVSLDAALRDLAKTYRPGMAVTILLSDAAARELGRGQCVTHSIGLYRICELGLLNAAIHGHATECSIHISIAARDQMLLALHDNGVGLPATTAAVPGMGSTVISAWVEALGGEWSLKPANVGMTLTASLPCS